MTKKARGESLTFPIRPRRYSRQGRTERDQLERAGLDNENINRAIYDALQGALRHHKRGSPLPARLENELFRFRRAEIKRAEDGALVNLVRRFHREGYPLKKGARDRDTPTAFDKVEETINIKADNAQRIYYATLKTMS